jgi:hypothetical protein
VDAESLFQYFLQHSIELHTLHHIILDLEGAKHHWVDESDFVIIIKLNKALLKVIHEVIVEKLPLLHDKTRFNFFENLLVE